MNFVSNVSMYNSANTKLSAIIWETVACRSHREWSDIGQSIRFHIFCGRSAYTRADKPGHNRAGAASSIPTELSAWYRYDNTPIAN